MKHTNRGCIISNKVGDKFSGTQNLFLMILIIFIIFFLLLSYLFGLSNVSNTLIPISTFITLISITAGIWIAIGKYSINIESEKRLNKNENAESDIKLLTSFTEMMNIANARYPPIVSEKAIECLLGKINVIPIDSISDVQLKSLLNSAVIVPAYGTAAQDAAIAAIYNFGISHKILREPAICGLKSIKFFIETENKTEYEYKIKFISDYIQKLETL
jgi:hypothetical protein